MAPLQRGGRLTAAAPWAELPGADAPGPPALIYCQLFLVEHLQAPSGHGSQAGTPPLRRMR